LLQRRGEERSEVTEHVVVEELFVLSFRVSLIRNSQTRRETSELEQESEPE